MEGEGRPSHVDSLARLLSKLFLEALRGGPGPSLNAKLPRTSPLTLSAPSLTPGRRSLYIPVVLAESSERPRRRGSLVSGVNVSITVPYVIAGNLWTVAVNSWLRGQEYLREEAGSYHRYFTVRSFDYYPFLGLLRLSGSRPERIQFSSASPRLQAASAFAAPHPHYRNLRHSLASLLTGGWAERCLTTEGKAAIIVASLHSSIACIEDVRREGARGPLLPSCTKIALLNPGVNVVGPGDIEAVRVRASIALPNPVAARPGRYVYVLRSVEAAVAAVPGTLEVKTGSCFEALTLLISLMAAGGGPSTVSTHVVLSLQGPSEEYLLDDIGVFDALSRLSAIADVKNRIFSALRKLERKDLVEARALTATINVNDVLGRSLKEARTILSKGLLGVKASRRLEEIEARLAAMSEASTAHLLMVRLCEDRETCEISVIPFNADDIGSRNKTLKVIIKVYASIARAVQSLVEPEQSSGFSGQNAPTASRRLSERFKRGGRG